MSRGFGIRRHDPPPHTEQETPRQREDVIERQCRHNEKTIYLRRDVDHRLIPRLDLQQVGHQISVQQHRALRDPCGTARVLQECQVIRSDSRRDGFSGVRPQAHC